jgi:hypothetical protein
MSPTFTWGKAVPIVQTWKLRHKKRGRGKRHKRRRRGRRHKKRGREGGQKRGSARVGR